MGPNFICLGAQKAGTAWLSQCLQAHPELWNPGIKELHFFDRAESSDNEIKNISVALTKNRLKKLKRKAKSKEFLIKEDFLQAIIKSKQITFQDYLNFFALAPSTRKTWEITPSYGCMGIKKIEKMNELLPDTKYLYIVRDPVNRALSSLRMTLERRSRSNSDEEQSTIIERWLKLQLDGGCYSKQIPKMNKILGDNQKIIFLPFGLIKNKPQEFMDQVEMHIGISKGDYKDLLSKPYHQTSKLITIPEQTKFIIETELQSEKNFLLNLFGEEFARNL